MPPTTRKTTQATKQTPKVPTCTAGECKEPEVKYGLCAEHFKEWSGMK